MKRTRWYMIHGAIGALVGPVAMVLLALARSLFASDSWMHGVLSSVLTTILAPAVWPLEIVLAAGGVHGEDGMAHLCLIFGTLLAYLALLGSLGGVVVGKLRKRRSPAELE